MNYFVHHQGRCSGGPYDGQYRDYFKEEMPVYSPFSVVHTGRYLWVPPLEGEREGRWMWSPLT